MTDEYIRKQDAVDDLHTQLMYRMGSDDMKRRLDDWAKTLPPADVVQVVRCKDCKYDISSQFDTEARCNLWGCLKPKRGFCDAGKRREE